MSDTVFKFGAGKGCTPIEVAPFTPICSKPAVPGSEALTLEVPAPVFAPVVPPQECACFTFTPQVGTVNVAMRKRSDITEAKPLQKEVSIAVAATGDCCNGAYTVTPTIKIDVPECVTPDKVIYSDTLNLGYGGSITYTLGIIDCVPYLQMSTVPVSVTLPDIPNLCLGNTSIKVNATYIDENGDEKTTQSEAVTVTSSVDKNNCQVYQFGKTGEIILDLTGLPTGGFGNGGSVFKDEDDNNLYMDGGLGDGNTWYGGGIGDRAANTHEEDVFCRGPVMRGYTSPAGSSGDHPVPYITNLSGSTSLFKITTGKGTKNAVAWCSRGRASDGSDAVGATPSGYVDGNLSMVMPTGFQWHAKGLAINLCDFRWNESGLLSTMHETGVAALVSPAPMVFSDNASAYGGVARAGAAASGLRIDPNKNSTTQPTTEPGLYINEGDGLRIFGLDAKTPTGEVADASGTPVAERIGRLEVMYGPGFRMRKANDGNNKPQYLEKPVDAAGALVPNDGRGLRVHGVTKTETTDAAQKNKLEVYGHSGDFLFNYDGKMVINDSKSGTDAERIITAPSFATAFDRTTDAVLYMATANIAAYHGVNDNVWGMNSANYLQVRTLTTNNAITAAVNYRSSAAMYVEKFGLTGTNGTDEQKAIAELSTALHETLVALDRISRVAGTLCLVPLAFSSAGTLMSTHSSAYLTAQNITRHYAESAS